WLNQYKSSSAPHLDEQSFEQAAELINVKLTKEVAAKERARVDEGRTGLRLLSMPHRMQRVIAAAASVLLIAVALVTIQLWRTSSEFSGISEDATSAYDHHPASKRAVLILDNG